jgi:hypothetical protein
MLTFDRSLLCGITTAAALPGLLLCLLISSPGLLSDAWDLPWLRPVVFPEQNRVCVRLDHQLDAILHHEEARGALGQELAEGRLGLLEAAARSRDLDRSAPYFQPDEFRRGFAGDSDDERHCREVIALLRSRKSPPGAAPTEELARRLEGELRDRLSRGTLRLPGSDGEPRAAAAH